MTTTIIRSDKWNTTITFVPQAFEGKPILRIWQGEARNGGTEISLTGTTEKGMTEELAAILDPTGHHAKLVESCGGVHDNSWRQILPQVR